MAPTEITQAHWNLICQRIYSRQCVPFLGAAVNLSHDNYAGLPSHHEIALHLFGELKSLEASELDDLAETIDGILHDYPELARIGLHDLARVALRIQLDYDTDYLQQKLHTILPDTNREPSAILQTLARFPLDLIVTANYDRLMEEALTWRCKVIAQPTNGFSAEELELLQLKLGRHKTQEAGPLIYKIHGSFPGGSQRIPWTVDGELKAVSVNGEKLHQRLTDAFSEGDLNTICFRLGIDYENLPAIGKSNKARELVKEVQRQDRQLELVEMIKRERPNIDLDDVLEESAPDDEAAEGNDGQPVFVTEEDYLNFLTIAGRLDNSGIPNLIKGRMTQRTLLFLGFDLGGWSFRTIYKTLVEELGTHKKPLSFAIQKDPPDFWFRFWDKKDITVYNMDLYEFAEELDTRYEAFRQKQERTNG